MTTKQPPNNATGTHRDSPGYPVVPMTEATQRDRHPIGVSQSQCVWSLRKGVCE